MEDISSEQGTLKLKKSIEDLFNELGIRVNYINWGQLEDNTELKEAFRTIKLEGVPHEEVYRFVEREIDKIKQYHMDVFDKSIAEWIAQGQKISDNTTYESRDHKEDDLRKTANEQITSVMNWYKTLP